METELIHTLTSTFEAHAQQTEGGTEFWLARDLQYLLGYAEWRNFSNTMISKAKTACKISGQAVSDHFVDVNKMIDSDFHNPRQTSRVIIYFKVGTKYDNWYIRPLAVSPLVHPERVPIPWGFPFLGSGKPENMPLQGDSL